MSAEDAALRWGLPPGFRPLCFPVATEVKELMRTLLNADEPVIATLANEGDSISVVATPHRVFSIRSGMTAGVTGFTVREFPWEGISDLRLQSMPMNIKIAIHFKSTDGGRTAEVGRRAVMAKPAVDNLTLFESGAGTQVFEALYGIWQHKKSLPDESSESLVAIF